ncbi:uncharacterized protein LOC134213919 [Armigeres subalbatus]|uniref:uncharacterized protein LOC134213919 n=1 Tax=Armigeres subalbatus TaxID=124917 RepID=UPI002ED51ACE
MYPQNLLTIPAYHHFERQISEPIIPTSPAVSSPPEARSAPDQHDEPSTPVPPIPQIRQIHLQTDRTSSPTVVLVSDMESLQQQHQHHLSGSAVASTSTGGASAPITTITTTSTTSSTAAVLLADLSSSTPSSIHIKGGELSRSASSPLMSSRSKEIPGLDSQRSSHCPVVREGPAHKKNTQI